MISFSVLGTPAPQGSKRAFVVNGRAVMVEASKRVIPWRDSVAAAGMQAMDGKRPIDAPVIVGITFLMPRPKTVKRKYPTVAPDLDKLVRGCLDGLTAGGVIADDARVVGIAAQKFYATEAPGALIVVSEVAA